MESHENQTPKSGSSNGDAALASELIEKVLGDIRAEKDAADRGPRAIAELKGKRTRQQFFGVQALLASRSGLERRVQADAIDALAAQEYKEAANGRTN